MFIGGRRRVGLSIDDVSGDFDRARFRQQGGEASRRVFRDAGQDAGAERLAGPVGCQRPAIFGDRHMLGVHAWDASPAGPVDHPGLTQPAAVHMDQVRAPLARQPVERPHEPAAEEPFALNDVGDIAPGEMAGEPDGVGDPDEPRRMQQRDPRPPKILGIGVGTIHWHLADHGHIHARPVQAAREFADMPLHASERLEAPDHQDDPSHQNTPASRPGMTARRDLAASSSRSAPT